MDRRWYDYLVEFHATRDYYACHDYLEEWWFEIDNPKNHILVAFIQLAVGMYHWRRKNTPSANTLFRKSYDKFRMNQNQIQEFGIEEQELYSILEKLLFDTKYENEYYDVNLPITDSQMRDKVHKLCLERNVVLYNASDLSNDFLINKHIHKYNN